MIELGMAMAEMMVGRDLRKKYNSIPSATRIPPTRRGTAIRPRSWKPNSRK